MNTCPPPCFPGQRGPAVAWARTHLPSDRPRDLVNNCGHAWRETHGQGEGHARTLQSCKKPAEVLLSAYQDWEPRTSYSRTIILYCPTIFWSQCVKSCHIIHQPNKRRTEDSPIRSFPLGSECFSDRKALWRCNKNVLHRYAGNLSCLYVPCLWVPATSQPRWRPRAAAEAAGWPGYNVSPEAQLSVVYWVSEVQRANLPPVQWRCWIAEVTLNTPHLQSEQHIRSRLWV